MSPVDCERLLRAGVMGRIAVCSARRPHIVPVNYAVVDDAVIVRTCVGSILGGISVGHPLAIEIDQVDYEYQRGWSVVAHGAAEWIDDDEMLDHIADVWAPRPWAAGERTAVLRVRWTELEGRRLGLGWDLDSTLLVKRTI